MNLITGATGLLGSHIAEKLVQQGQPVRVLVRKSSDTEFLDSLGVEKAYGDITDPTSLDAAMKGVERVYHSAAQVGDWGKWENFVNVTINGTQNMIDAAKKANVKRFCHISSISAYGHRNKKGMIIDETYPLGYGLYKWAYYSRAKVVAENLVWDEHKKGDLPATVVKPSWLYGPRDRASMPRIIRAIRNRKAKIVGDGNNLLNLTYAGNEAEGCILACTMDKALGESYNLSSDGEITQSQYFNKVAECLGAKPVTRKVPYPIVYRAAYAMEIFGHLFKMKKPPLVTRYSVWLMGRHSFFSCEKARRELNWQPTVKYDEGIEMSVKWCIDHGIV